MKKAFDILKTLLLAFIHLLLLLFIYFLTGVAFVAVAIFESMFTVVDWLDEKTSPSFHEVGKWFN